MRRKLRRFEGFGLCIGVFARRIQVVRFDEVTVERHDADGHEQTHASRVAVRPRGSHLEG